MRLVSEVSMQINVFKFSFIVMLLLCRFPTLSATELVSPKAKKMAEEIQVVLMEENYEWDNVVAFLQETLIQRLNSNNGNTLLHWAVESRNMDAIKWLSCDLAGFYYKNINGNTALEIAKEKGYSDIKKQLNKCYSATLVEAISSLENDINEQDQKDNQLTDSTCGKTAQEIQFELRINGRGFFRVLKPPGVVAYTREGRFKTNHQCLIETTAGFPLEPEIRIPPNTLKVEVRPTGEVLASLKNENRSIHAGRIEISRFYSFAGLVNIGKNLFMESFFSGFPYIEYPGEDGAPTISQGETDLTIPPLGNWKGAEHDIKISIQGPGYFRLLLPNKNLAYTRSGKFNLGPNGVITFITGVTLEPEIVILPEFRRVKITPNGLVYVFIKNGKIPYRIGSIELSLFPNKKELIPIGGDVYVASKKAGKPIIATPGTNGLGVIVEGVVHNKVQ